MVNKLTKNIGLFGLTCFLSSAAHANLYSYSVGGQDTPVGTLASLNTRYNSHSEDFYFDYAIADDESAPGTPVINDSFWLVVTDGPLPEQGNTETVIFYGDANDPNQLKLTAYRYDDALAANSFQDPLNFIGNFSSELSFEREQRQIFSQTKDVSHFNFAFNVAELNQLFPDNPAWRGVKFDEEVGIWLRMFDGDFTYDGDEITSMNVPDGRGFFDRGPLSTRVTLPTPSGLLLLPLALLAALKQRRRQVNNAIA